jgi:hypothetical protein
MLKVKNVSVVRRFRFVCLSVRMEQLGFHWTDFDKICYLRVFRKSVEKIQVSLTSDNNSGYFRQRAMYICDSISLKSSQNEKCFRRKLYRKSEHRFYVQ